jgi:uncharacterized protein YyaL (SSP411 family)
MPNRLIHEQSPYLRQHAQNPVDWYPWGPEAFAKAVTEEKPIFLSIGYSTCHWCHVMERESFENEDVAAYLNANFVSIKVDREERPDIDHIYMAAVQAMSGSGGWPMTLFLAPDLKPFFGGTYFPPVPAHGRPSFFQLLERVHELWSSDRASLLASSETLAKTIHESSMLRGQESGATKNWHDIADSAFEYFQRAYDRTEGGFGGAPKFPRPVQFDFLFNYFGHAQDESAREMPVFTLRKMALGGINDQLGGGFHRYSVDRVWRVSHFEKMLYDQAQLVQSFLDAYLVSRDSFFAEVAESILRYVQHDLTHPLGGFFSAEDADSEGKEGTFYVWKRSEIEKLLGPDDAPIVCEYFGLTDEGNFEHGENVLYVARTFDELKSKGERSQKEIEEILACAKSRLLEVRNRRVRPSLDDKILTSWNGMMVGAMARAGAVLGKQEWLDGSIRAANFLWSELREKSPTLLHRWRENDASIPAYLDDYAFLIAGFLHLYDATLEAVWLSRATQLQDEQNAALFDEEFGAYFMSRAAPDLIFRAKSDYDGAEPSGNSVAVGNLVHLAALTGNALYNSYAERTLGFFHTRSERHPYAMPELIVSAMRFETAGPQIALVGEIGALQDFRHTISRYYLPDAVLLHADPAAQIDPFYKELAQVGGLPTVYLCQNYACELPVTSVDALKELLTKLSTVRK